MALICREQIITQCNVIKLNANKLEYCRLDEEVYTFERTVIN